VNLCVVSLARTVALRVETVKLPVVDPVGNPFFRSVTFNVSLAVLPVIVAATRSASNSHAAGMTVATALVGKLVVPLSPTKAVLAAAPPGFENWATKV